MARVRKQKRREAAGEWVQTIDRPNRYRRPGSAPDEERALYAMAQLRTRWERERGVMLVRWLARAGPVHLLRDHVLLSTLSRVEWPNAPRRFGRTLVQSEDALVDRLLAVHPLPPVLRLPFRPAHVARRGRLVFGRLASHVGGGGSFKGARALGLLPDSVTRRIYREFINGSAHHGLMGGWRLAQAKAIGAPRWTAVAVHRRSRWTQCRTNFWEQDAYWLAAMRWMGQRVAEPQSAGPIMDFLCANPIDLSGRTEASVMRLVEAWHETLYRPRRPVINELTVFPEVRLIVRLPAFADWSVAQLTTPMELWEEGRSMSHCVWSYRRRAADGSCSIWSIREHGARRLTVEMQRGRIVQVRGPRNRAADADEARVVQAWASANQLRL